MTIVYAMIPPENDEKSGVLSSEAWRKAQKIIPYDFSVVICGNGPLQISISLALNIPLDNRLKILGDSRINEETAQNIIETFEDKTLLITTRAFVRAVEFQDIRPETMLVKIIAGEVWNDIEEIA